MSAVELLPFDPANDAGLIAQWVRKPHVSRWWGDPETQLAAVLQRPIGGSDALIAVEGAPVGYVRWQVAPRGELDVAGLAEVPSGTIDIDIAIGDERFVGHGVGPAALAQVVARVRLASQPPMIIMCTSVANGSALRAFTKAGFRPLRQFDVPECGRFWLLSHGASSGANLAESASRSASV